MMGCRHGVALCLVVSSASDAQPLVAIADHTDHAHPTFVMDRCEDFVDAVAIYGQILASNPVYGRNADRKKPFAWAVSVGDDIRAVRAEFPRQHESVVAAYMDRFGPVTVPTLVPNIPLYQSDKATCLKEFGTNDE